MCLAAVSSSFMDKVIVPKCLSRFAFAASFWALLIATAMPVIPPIASPAAATGHALSIPDSLPKSATPF